MEKFISKCILCGSILKKNNFCKNHNSLTRTEYKNKKLQICNKFGIWKFYSWLPCYNDNIEGEAPVTYKSKEFAKYLRLKNLYISFNGYWPEKGAKLQTCSFKDLESTPTIQKLVDENNNSDIKKILVVASAGNTARAFLYTCIKYRYPLIVIIPKSSLDKIWIPDYLDYNSNELFPLIISVDGDYTDSINICHSLVSNFNDIYIEEGGAKNIARRDGMGTVMLDATRIIGKIPDYYIQAVGSGTGGIAAYEASLRLIKDGNYGNKVPQIFLFQNIPHAPLLNLWNNTKIINYNNDNIKIIDEVLYNRKPPYNISGGIKDILLSSNGKIYGITNEEAISAKNIFESLEQIDISYASSVSVAGLIYLLNNNIIDNDKNILLNITCGGVERFKSKNKIKFLNSHINVNPHIMSIEKIVCLINNYIKNNYLSMEKI